MPWRQICVPEICVNGKYVAINNTKLQQLRSYNADRCKLITTFTPFHSLVSTKPMPSLSYSLKIMTSLYDVRERHYMTSEDVIIWRQMTSLYDVRGYWIIEETKKYFITLNYSRPYYSKCLRTTRVLVERRNSLRRHNARVLLYARNARDLLNYTISQCRTQVNDLIHNLSVVNKYLFSFFVSHYGKTDERV